MKKLIIILVIVGIVALVGYLFYDPGEVPVEVRKDLNSSVDYLSSLREKAGPESQKQLERDQAEYEAFKTTRINELRNNHPYGDYYSYWNDEQFIGWDTWINWTGGSQYLWRRMAKDTDGLMDIMKLVDNKILPREERFSRFGLINSPAASAPQGPDEYGYWFDVIDDYGDSDETKAFMGTSSGIMGIRKFPNPKFDPGRWDSSDPWGNPADVEPPYIVGLTCGFCHVSFNPSRPPEDIVNPKWENLAAAMGNIYLGEGPLFAYVLGVQENDFRYHVLNQQPHGTSDTSRIATDDIDNPNAINAIFQLDARVAAAEEEVMPNGSKEAVPHILKDGADSVGVPLASVRVYVNIGLLGDYWLQRHDANMIFNGVVKKQQPFEIDVAMNYKNAVDGAFYWNRTEVRMADAKSYLATETRFKLADAPGGAAHLTDLSELEAGRIAFAENCGECHSSKQPPGNLDPTSDEYKKAMGDIVMKDDFLEGNFLSTDKRYPATRINANIARTMGTNATNEHIWDNFSSVTYKNQPRLGEKSLFNPKGKLSLYNPFNEDRPIKFRAPAGGRGYYRVASLVNIWSTAPWLHNNSVGTHLQDPSLEGRLKAFEDAAEQFFWPEKREKYIKRSLVDSDFELPNKLKLPIPKGTPIKLIANLPMHRLAEFSRRVGSLVGVPLDEKLISDEIPEKERTKIEEALGKLVQNNRFQELIVKVLMPMNLAPDFVENHGHEDIVNAMNDDQKRSLIEFMKHF